MLKGGVVYANAVTTVSPTYAKECLDHGAAGALKTTLLTHRQKFSGLLNGIDTMLWNPECDPSLPVSFGADSLGGKAVVKRYLRRGLGLQDDEEAGRRPLVVCVTRLVPQKGALTHHQYTPKRAAASAPLPEPHSPLPRALIMARHPPDQGRSRSHAGAWRPGM